MYMWCVSLCGVQVCKWLEWVNFAILFSWQIIHANIIVSVCTNIYLFTYEHSLSHTHVSLLLLYGFLFYYCCCGCYSFFSPLRISLNCNFLALNLPEDVRVLWGLVTWLATQFAGLVTNVAAYVLLFLCT